MTSAAMGLKNPGFFIAFSNPLTHSVNTIFPLEPWFQIAQFQLLSSNHYLPMVNGNSGNQQLISVKLHVILSSVMKSHASSFSYPAPSLLGHESPFVRVDVNHPLSRVSVSHPLSRVSTCCILSAAHLSLNSCPTYQISCHCLAVIALK